MILRSLARTSSRFSSLKAATAAAITCRGQDPETEGMYQNPLPERCSKAGKKQEATPHRSLIIDE